MPRLKPDSLFVILLVRTMHIQPIGGLEGLLSVLVQGQKTQKSEKMAKDDECGGSKPSLAVDRSLGQESEDWGSDRIAPNTGWCTIIEGLVLPNLLLSSKARLGAWSPVALVFTKWGIKWPPEQRVPGFCQERGSELKIKATSWSPNHRHRQ